MGLDGSVLRHTTGMWDHSFTRHCDCCCALICDRTEKSSLVLSSLFSFLAIICSGLLGTSQQKTRCLC